MVRLFLVPALTLFALFVRAVRGLVSILHAEGARLANGRAEVARTVAELSCFWPVTPPGHVVYGRRSVSTMEG